MSGICGIANFNGVPVEPEVIQRMAHAAAHRGPDGIHYYTSGNIGLAHLATNFTPESVRERQPLVGNTNDLIVTADARIDNRDELFRTLKVEGYLGEEAHSEADLILAAYRCWETELPAHLIGDFAFAIWDVRRQRLFAARDPLGRRAFYYRTEPRKTLFATEIKQLLAVPGVPARVFEPMIGAYLSGEGGFQEWTFYEGIAQLPPAYALTAHMRGIRTWRYWDVDPNFNIEYADEEQYAEHFTEVFLEAVRDRLRSAKPVGIYLSGGLDSGSVAAAGGWLLRRMGSDNPPFHPYCFAFDELTECDERYISDGIVRHYDLPVTYVPADMGWPLKDYPAHGPDKDDPCIGIFQVLHDRTLAIARDEGMGSMLTGGFGDLVMDLGLWGYLDLLYTGRWRNLWRDLRTHSRLDGVPVQKVAGAYVWNPLKASIWPSGRAEHLRRLYRWMRRRQGSRAPYPDWIRSEFAVRVELADILRQSVPQSSFRGYARDERYKAIFDPFNTRAVVWGDRIRARYGMYETDPWADRRTVEFALAVPQRVLNQAGEEKRLARRSMRGIMPEKTRQAATRIGVKALFDRAFRQRAVNTVLDLVSNSRVADYGFVDEQELAENYMSFKRGEHENATFWYTLSVEMWLRQHWS
jgi:asparagine synthase (glutamine-hydrolysing)